MGILPARILEQIAMPSSSRGSSLPSDGVCICLCLLHWQVGSLALRGTIQPWRITLNVGGIPPRFLLHPATQHESIWQMTVPLYWSFDSYGKLGEQNWVTRISMTAWGWLILASECSESNKPGWTHVFWGHWIESQWLLVRLDRQSYLLDCRMLGWEHIIAGYTCGN